MSLNDFRPDKPDFNGGDIPSKSVDNQIPASSRTEEINTLKIDKLSNRITIISIILPCLIGAVIIFAYQDMKERVVDVDTTKANRTEQLFQQVEEKLNALDVKIAKNRYDLDTELPVLENKHTSIEGQMVKLAGAKADSDAVNKKLTQFNDQILKQTDRFTAFTDQLSKAEKRIGNNANQDKATLQTMERINKERLQMIHALESDTKKTDGTIKTMKDQNKEMGLRIQGNRKKLDETAKSTSAQIKNFKKKLAAGLQGGNKYEQEIGLLRKNLSILDKKVKELDKNSRAQTRTGGEITGLKTEITGKVDKLDTKMESLIHKYDTLIERLQKDIKALKRLKNSTSSNVPGSTTTIKPQPQITIDSSDMVNIED